MGTRGKTGLEITPQEITQFEFLNQSDRKSLFKHIKALVTAAQEFSNEDVNRRRAELQNLLEYEDKIYEIEFAQKVKMRMVEDIQTRKNKLFAIKEESQRTEQKFLQKKRIQQNIESCYEIRKMLREKERRNVMETHLAQMLDRERAIAKEREQDKYWPYISKINAEKQLDEQQQERCLKREMALNNRRVLEIQLQEQANLRQQQIEQKRKDAAEVDRVIREMRLERIEEHRNKKAGKVLQYRKELLDMMAEVKSRNNAERAEEAEIQRQLIKTIKEAEEAEKLAQCERKCETYKALVEFINYARNMRKLEEAQQKMRDCRTDDLSRVDMCTKRNMQLEAEKRAERAHACYCELRKQICEEAERRLREEAERKENKILQNLFVHREVPWKEVVEKRRKYHEELDKQIEALKLIRAKEDESFHNDILRASNDPEVCEQLAAEYLREGTDYLDPHTNWRILLCPPSKAASVYQTPAAHGPKDGTGDQANRTCPECFGCEGKHCFKCQFQP